MRTDANAVTGHEFVSLHPDLEAVKDWAKRAFPKERIAEVGVVTATLVLLGYLGAVVYQGLHTFTMVGL
jgi:hypothetical protein